MKSAFVFPGQGSQFTGMGRDLAEHSAVARETFATADRVLGFPLSRLCFEGPDEQLVLTENTQPAILTVSVAAWRILRERGHAPALVAGHSLGEYSALVAAGSLRFEDAVEVVRLRGRFMQEAVPPGQGAMAAILGMDLEQVEALCREVAGEQVVAPANLNAPGQVVVAGHVDAVNRACEAARGAGARRVIELPVSAPFHCDLMRPARDRLALELERIEFGDLEVPLVNNVEAALVRTGEEARQGLIRQVTGAVRWIDCVQALAAQSVSRYVEVGPGRVLSGLIRKIDATAETAAVGNWEQVQGYE